MTFLNRLKFILFVLFLISYGEIYAQESVNVSGGDASGINGSVSYTFGQLVYTSFSANNGYVDQGIQHPKETMITLAIDDEFENLPQMDIYPNPAVEFINLHVKNLNWQDLEYHIFDVNGRALKREKFNGENTSINLKELKPSVYFLRINNQYENIRNFKIIKTN